MVCAPSLTVRAAAWNIGDGGNYKVVWRSSKFLLEPRPASRDHIHGQHCGISASRAGPSPGGQSRRGGGTRGGGDSSGAGTACTREAARSQMLVVEEGMPASHLCISFPPHGSPTEPAGVGGGGLGEDPGPVLQNRSASLLPANTHLLTPVPVKIRSPPTKLRHKTVCFLARYQGCLIKEMAPRPGYLITRYTSRPRPRGKGGQGCEGCGQYPAGREGTDPSLCGPCCRQSTRRARPAWTGSSLRPSCCRWRNRGRETAFPPCREHVGVGEPTLACPQQ